MNSMAKMSKPCEDHGHILGIGCRDDLRIADAAAGLNGGRSACLGGREEAIGDGYEGIGSDDAAG